jgi:DNA-binding transcriptional MerR regulator
MYNPKWHSFFKKRKLVEMLKPRQSRPASTPDTEGYNSSEVARICGVSLRQLQWWDERNVVSPRQDGHRRIYQTQEVVEISVIAELRRKGFSLQKIRRVLRFLQKDMGKRLAEALNSTSDIHLLTDGKTIYLEEAPNRIIDLLKNARQPMFLVCVTDQVKRLAPAEKKPARSETSSPRKARAV